MAAGAATAAPAEPFIRDTDSSFTRSADEPSRGLFSRIRGILLSPKQEWPVIAGESASAMSVLQGYVVPLAGFLAIVSFVHVSLIGVSIPFAGTVRTPLVAGLVEALFTCVMAVIGVCIVAAIINALAPRFGGVRQWRQALKTAAYSLTPGFVGSLFGLLPAMGTLLGILAGIYGIYVLYLGLPVVMRAQRERAGAYTAWVVICTIILGFVLGAASALVGVGSGRMLSAMRPVESREAQRERGAAMVSNVLGNALGTDEKGKAGLASALSNLAKAGEQVEAQQAAPSSDAGRAAPSASAQSAASSGSGSADPTQNAVGAVGGLLSALGGAMGGANPKQPVDFHKLQDALPATVAGLPRTHIEGGSKQAMGIKAASAKATYGSGNSRIEIEVSDMSGVAGLMDLASALPENESSESDSSYEKHITLDGRAAQEKFDSRSRHGELSTMVAKRFSVDVTSDGLSVGDLEKALGQVNLSALESMKNVGGQP
jgi:Yip1 domain